MGSVTLELSDGRKRQVSREVLSDLKDLAELKVGDVSDEPGVFCRTAEAQYKINEVDADFMEGALDAAEHHVKGRETGLTDEELLRWDKGFIEKQQWPAERIWGHSNTAYLLGHMPLLLAAAELLRLEENRTRVLRLPFNVYDFEFTERVLGGIPYH